MTQVIRNKKMHYRELAADVQKDVGEVPVGYMKYFNAKFPTLMIALYRFAMKHLMLEERFKSSYFS